MKFKINKIALSLATAFLMVSSIVSMVGSAAGTNKITLSADKTDVSAGDKINVSVGFSPDSQGAAGLTVSLHYDSSKLEVYIPSDGEIGSTYNVGSKFSVITNYGASEDTVKIVGANLTGSNVTSETPLALATFTVKDGASGDLNFWVDVETMVRTAGEGYETAPYSVPTQNAPFTVNGPVGAVTTTVTSAEPEEVSSATTTTAVTEPVQKTETSEIVTTIPDVTEAPVDTEEPEETTADTQAPAETEEPEETTVDTQAPVETEEPEETTADTQAPVETEEPEETTADTQAPAEIEEPEETAADTQAPVEIEESQDTETFDSEPIFSYVQGDSDFNSETAVQYGFKLSDYITDYSTNYNINVNIRTTGNVSGAVGMLIDGKWDSQPSKSYNVSEDTWVYENLDPNASSDTVYAQVYYLKANAEFEVVSVEAVPVYDSSEEIPVIDADETEIPDETSAETVTEVPETDAATVVTTVSEEGESVVSSDSNSAEEIISTVDSASQQAQDSAPSTENPNTGAGARVMNILTVLAAAEILFSVFVVIYNKVSCKKDEE